MTAPAACPACGAAVRPDSPWCTLCYADLRPKPPEPAPPPEPQPQPQLTWTPEPQPAGVQQADPLTAPLPAGEGSPAPTWPCTTCGAANPIERDTCVACGSGFLAAARSDAPLLQLPVVGDITRLGRGQRFALAGGFVLVVLALLLVLMLAVG